MVKRGECKFTFLSKINNCPCCVLDNGKLLCLALMMSTVNVVLTA